MPFAIHGQTILKNQPVIVRVRSQCLVRSERLFLGDLATIVTADSEAATRLRAIELGYAPNVGTLRELSRERIALAIAAVGFSERTVRLEAPPIVTIRREAQSIDHSLIREAVEHATLVGLQSKGATARLLRLDLPPTIEAPTGVVELRASLGGVRNMFAPFAVSIEIWIDGRIARRFNATAQVEAFAPVLVAAHDLTEKTRLREGDFTIAIKQLFRSAAFYVTEPAQLRGVSVVRSLSLGDAITVDAITAEFVIKPGDSVRIIGESRGLKISVSGEARAAGRVGDRIQVKNLQSGIIFQAIVVDEGVVSVRF
ncbi:MAG: flagellar basal body P-ring formation protein FlgA [Blastocatellia bacterium]|nr:flagellar basal body P-ring formation protein FlgA [Blastocatellia bacterium]